MVTLARRVARTPLKPVIALMFGGVAAILVIATPGWLFEQSVVASGLSGLFGFAQPPLGVTARLFAILLAFFGVAGAIWAIWSLAEQAQASIQPWHDAGYDTPLADAALPPRRRPIFATGELGAPLMSDAAIVAPTAAKPFIDLPEGDASISALIERLEAGLARRATNDDPEGGAPLSLTPQWMADDEAKEPPANDDRIESAMRKFSWR